MTMNTLFLSVVLSAVVFSSTVVAQCYPGWVYHGSSCYGFGEEKLSWAGASAICRMMDGSLAEIETLAENHFLKSYARNHSDVAVWIGGTDVFSESNWIWEGSRKQLSDGFTDWASGEPNHDGGESNEDCLQLYGHKGYQWNDEDCQLTFPFVCEVQVGEL